LILSFDDFRNTDCCCEVVGYLTDEDFCHFLQQCKIGLKEDGVIILKENVSSTKEFIFDEEDKSICRSYDHFMKIFAQVGLTIVDQIKTRDFPKGLFPIYIFALKSINH
jgi:protein N-terminal methyltransferase